jgi:hypothetical protein
LSTTDKLFEKFILKIVQRHIEERDLLNASQFDFSSRHSTTLQCMRLTDHITLHFSKNMSTAAVILYIEKAFDTSWRLGLLYKLSKLKCSIRLIKPISSFLSHRKFRGSVEGEISTSRDISRGATRFHTVPHIVQYIYDMPQTPDVYLHVLTEGIYTDRKEVYVLKKLQRGLSAIETWRERWNIKINEDRTQAIYFSHTLRPPEAHLTPNGRNIPLFVNHVQYLGVIFHKRIA